MIRAVQAGLAASLLAMIPAIAQQPSARGKPESKQVKIARALASGPPNITKDAKVVDVDEDGKEAVLREGRGGFTCFPGHTGVIGDVAYVGRYSLGASDDQPAPVSSVAS